MVLLADGEGAEHDCVGIRKLAEAGIGIADELEGIHQLLRLWTQRCLDCRDKTLHGGAGLGELAFVEEIISSRPLNEPAPDVRCRGTGSGQDLKRSDPSPATCWGQQLTALWVASQ